MTKRVSKRREAFSRHRKKIGTQKKVASMIGVSEVYIRLIESGTLMPGRDTMFKLSDVLGAPVEELFPDYFQNIPQKA
ncbi:helix-turn-helix transcriptional regulator [Paenibacillus thermotolerans]|uniref:helix-turn-helix transcriptional regulator n=1 Tax=Paenibacillus thermotolerans TaxID=3027807 RepID=UPI002367BBC0|nr:MULTISPECIES: helix-turn-helix transcriptional regulator [unclassified Paenibacillus]